MSKKMRKQNHYVWQFLLCLLIVGCFLGCSSSKEPLIADTAVSGTVKAYLPKDEEPPSLDGVEDMHFYLGNEIDLMANITVVDNVDVAPTVVADTSRADLGKAGNYVISYIARDFSGNMTICTAGLTLISDTQGPQILGVNPLSIYVGSTVSYRSGILVEDDYTAQPQLTIDSGQVDLSQPGTYPVIYRALDDAGNETVLETTITVHEQNQSYVEAEVVYAEADKLLDKIIKENMTTQEQVEAIYDWFQRNCYYISTSDKADRLQAAYKILTGKRGDCYNYYAACTVLLERLGIPYISVERAPDASRQSRHYWSMVSLDGGETYYHLDVSPHVYFDIKTCLVTDTVLDRCNLYAPGYYDMEEGKYPKTPEQ